MTARIKSAKMENGSVVQVTVEAEVIDKGVGIHLVGLADREVKESLLRVITALTSKGYEKVSERAPAFRRGKKAN